MALPEVPVLQSLTPDPDAEITYSVAIIKDGLVYQVMNVDGQTAALLLSGPTFVQVDNTEVLLGDSYDSVSKTFSR